MKHDDALQKALGLRLAKARRAAGLSLQGSASKLEAAGMGVSRATVGAWEDGRNVPDAIVIGQLARIYATSADELTGNGVLQSGLPADVLARISALSADNLRGLTIIVSSFLDAVGGAPQSAAETDADAPALHVTKKNPVADIGGTGHKGMRRISGAYVAPKSKKGSA